MERVYFLGEWWVSFDGLTFERVEEKPKLSNMEQLRSQWGQPEARCMRRGGFEINCAEIEVMAVYTTQRKQIERAEPEESAESQPSIAAVLELVLKDAYLREFPLVKYIDVPADRSARVQYPSSVYNPVTRIDVEGTTGTPIPTSEIEGKFEPNFVLPEPSFSYLNLQRLAEQQIVNHLDCSPWLRVRFVGCKVCGGEEAHQYWCHPAPEQPLMTLLLNDTQLPYHEIMFAPDPDDARLTNIYLRHARCGVVYQFDRSRVEIKEEGPDGATYLLGEVRQLALLCGTCLNQGRVWYDRHTGITLVPYDDDGWMVYGGYRNKACLDCQPFRLTRLQEEWRNSSCTVWKIE
jgi:hypothetical protein